MSEISVNGTSLYYEDCGDGEPIVCIHGTGSCADVWRGAVAAFSERGRAIAYDRRSFSRSPCSEPLAMDVHVHADDAAALIEALGAAPAVVVGRSQGGEIALDLALRYPAHVRALVLLEGGGLWLSPAFRRWVRRLWARIETVAAGDVAGVGEAFLRDVVGDAGWESLPGEVQSTFRANSAAILAEERGGLLDATADELGAIEQPALVIAATDSPRGFAEAMQRAAAAIPRARLEWVRGDHLVDPADPAVLAFIDEVLAASGTPAG